MDAIAPINEMTVQQKQTVPINGETDSTPFQYCLKESVERQVSQENENSENPTIDNEASPEAKETGNSEKSENSRIFPEADCWDAALYQIQNTINPVLSENEASETSAITDGLSKAHPAATKIDIPQQTITTKSGEKNIVFQISSNNELEVTVQQQFNALIEEERTDNILERFLNSNNTEMINDDSMIRNFIPSDESNGQQGHVISEDQISNSNQVKIVNGDDQPALEAVNFTVRNKQEVTNSQPNPEILIVDPVIGNFTPSVESNENTGQAFIKKQVSKSNEYPQLSQTLNAQKQGKDIQIIDSTEPLASQTSGKLEGPLESAKMNTASSFRELQTNDFNGQINVIRDEPTPSGNSAKDHNNHSLTYKSSQTEEIRGNPFESLSTIKEDGNVGHEKTFIRDLNAAFKISDLGQSETIQFFSMDNRSTVGKSAESRIVQPQVLMEQIVEGGAQVIQKGSGRVRMTLNPPNLGALDMDIQVRNNKVEVVFVADTPEIQQSLQANVDLLKTALSQQGLKVDGYNVFLQGNMDHNNAYYSDEGALWRNPRQDGGRQGNHRNKPGRNDVIRNLNSEMSSARMDNNKISLFI